MAQFDVYENTNTENSQLVPYLLDVQSNLLSGLSTRVVIPLYVPEAVEGRFIQRLAPTARLRGKKYVALTSELAGIPLSLLGSKVANLADSRGEIIAALDMLITGI